MSQQQSGLWTLAALATLSPVPEPSLTLLVLAAATVLGLRRRRPVTTQS